MCSRNCDPGGCTDYCHPVVVTSNQAMATVDASHSCATAAPSFTPPAFLARTVQEREVWECDVFTPMLLAIVFVVIVSMWFLYRL